jgi:hypothetical protein
MMGVEMNEVSQNMVYFKPQGAKLWPSGGIPTTSETMIQRPAPIEHPAFSNGPSLQVGLLLNTPRSSTKGILVYASHACSLTYSAKNASVSGQLLTMLPDIFLLCGGLETASHSPCLDHFH